MKEIALTQFRVTVEADILIDAPDEYSARQYVGEFLATSKGSLMGTPIISARIVRSQDRQWLTKIPNIPQDRVLTLLAAMSELEQMILVLCTSPVYSHVVYTQIRKARPTIELSEIARAAAHLTYEGWLVNLKYNQERSIFPNTGATAQYDAHNRTKDYQRGKI